MATHLFKEFEPISSKQWKQQIQFELKGADYNETLVWESPEGIKVKPFYHIDENEVKIESPPSNGFRIIQNIYVYDVKKSNERALDSLKRGAESVRFTIENDAVSLNDLMENLPKENVTYYFNLLFLSSEFIKKIDAFANQNQYKIVILQDPVGQLAKDGNWFESLEKDFLHLNTISTVSTPTVSCKIDLYQNAGANMVQQLAYAMAHVNEYFNRIEKISSPITFEVAVGTNYFFEIAKLRALRLLFNALAKEYNHDFDCHIIATPTKRNKTLYDYNVNMLRTTTECMSAILGGANGVSNLAYDAIYHKDNEFGDRISRNQLLVLKHESYFNQVHNPADGAYYIESLTEQLAEKALALFKDIEANGGLITQLIEGTIQRKISESAQKEQDLFDSGKEVLLGTNKYPNKNDKMNHELELFPFVKINQRKTLITPIIERRLAEKSEQERLSLEQQP
ncbi:methylmalonyl-CoA mutase subunit beta [Flavobacterium azooxidireducens]|uniref:Methylmalonyl-CoA mutase subunit beta n=1 Tax=Flavobacterium azooxidireducens TaxID=1871076 RepID=A0ABY4KBI7_9FLAO|nr:methylmalonyl-CoA mutase subunit beta [Flavobacterium azooxidireducens]UPQ78156.1 methylmalonyl-CoA mutase subunit beta [Flavobacterium azooxidireducens]